MCVCLSVHPSVSHSQKTLWNLFSPSTSTWVLGIWGSNLHCQVFLASTFLLFTLLADPQTHFPGEGLRSRIYTSSLQSRICCPTPVTFPVSLCPNPQGKDSLTWRIHWADKARSCRPSRLSPGSWTRLRGSGNSNWDLQSKSGLREAG